VVDNPGPVLSGELLTYTLNVENVGCGMATNTLVVDPVPANAMYVGTSCSATQGSCGLVGNSVEFQLGTMNFGDQAMLSFQVQVDPAPLPPGTIVNTGYSVDSDQTTPVVGSDVTTFLVPAELIEFESRVKM